MRTFETGALRGQLGDKISYKGCLSPAVLQAFGQYMNRHRTCEDGSKREWDNWKLGIPQESYMDSLLRHIWDLWMIREGIGSPSTPDIEEALGGVMFNLQGLWLEILKAKREEQAA